MNAQAAKDTATTTIVKPPYMQNRELSWLDFNKRVLDQGADPTVPLLERLNFISIFWSNLQEFFMVRVGSLTDLSLLKKSIIDPKSGMTPAQQLEAIYARWRTPFSAAADGLRVAAPCVPPGDRAGAPLAPGAARLPARLYAGQRASVPFPADRERAASLPSSGERRPVHRRAPR